MGFQTWISLHHRGFIPEGVIKVWPVQAFPKLPALSSGALAQILFADRSC